MALLPFVCHVPESEFDAVYAWCCQQWPYAKGATWQYVYLGYCWLDVLPGARLIGTEVDQFAFQFAEDHVLFVLTWNDTLVQLAQ